MMPMGAAVVHTRLTTTVTQSLISAMKLRECSGTEAKHRNLKKSENPRDDNFSKNSRMGVDMILV